MEVSSIYPAPSPGIQNFSKSLVSKLDLQSAKLTPEALADARNRIAAGLQRAESNGNRVPVSTTSSADMSPKLRNYAKQFLLEMESQPQGHIGLAGRVSAEAN